MVWRKGKNKIHPTLEMASDNTTITLQNQPKPIYSTRNKDSETKKKQFPKTIQQQRLKQIKLPLRFKKKRIWKPILATNAALGIISLKSTQALKTTKSY